MSRVISPILAAEWERAPRPAAPRITEGDGVDPNARRSQGGEASDPTGETVADGQRLRLRAAVLSAEPKLESLVRSIKELRLDLAAALQDWEGDADQKHWRA